MKYLILIGDGMGDLPDARLGCRTLLQAAHTPHMDRLAQQGLLGLMQTIPYGLPAGSDTANMSIMGYDPKVYHTGRSPIEAASIGVKMADDDVAFRCNLVVLNQNGAEVVMNDYAGGGITNAEAAEILATLNRELGGDGVTFHAGVGFRNCLIWRQGPLGAKTTPPHDRSGQTVAPWLEGDDPESARLVDKIKASWPILANHPVNQKRAAAGKPVVNSIWLWGQGTKPGVPSMLEQYGVTGCVVSAVDLVKGMGVLAGLDILPVEGATAYLDTNYAGKVAAALEGLQTHDLAYLHVEAPDETGHEGSLELKTKAIELFDEKVVGPIMEGMAQFEEFRVLLATDHYTSIATKTHGRQPVPFVIFDSQKPRHGGPGFNEADAAAAGYMVGRGHEIISLLVRGLDV